MFVILTSKPGQYRTEVGQGLRPLEAYDYLYYGQKKAHFVIAELMNENARVRIIEDGSDIVNDVPSKFLGRFETAERAYGEIKHLVTFGKMDTALRKTPVLAG